MTFTEIISLRQLVVIHSALVYSLITVLGAAAIYFILFLWPALFFPNFLICVLFLYRLVLSEIMMIVWVRMPAELTWCVWRSNWYVGHHVLCLWADKSNMRNKTIVDTYKQVRNPSRTIYFDWRWEPHKCRHLWEWTYLSCIRCPDYSEVMRTYHNLLSWMQLGLSNAVYIDKVPPLERCPQQKVLLYLHMERWRNSSYYCEIIVSNKSTPNFDLKVSSQHLHPQQTQSRCRLLSLCCV